MTTVLAVDDDPTLLHTLELNLKARGYAVATAHDGHTAISSVEHDRPDLVILDLGLPDLDGMAVLTRLRAVSRVPVVVLSARHGSEDKVAALDLGADDYVTKPFDIDELIARLRTALRHSNRPSTAAGRLIRTNSLVLDLDARVARRDGVDGAPHPDRVAALGRPHSTPGQPGAPGRPAARSVGSGLRPGNQLSSRVSRPAAPQTRARTEPAAAPDHRTRSRSPIRPLT